MVRLAIAVCVLATAAMHGTARADSPKIASARAAVEAVQYDDAQALLVAALGEGGNSPGAVAEIYRLSGTVAAVLGQRDVAEQYFRRWLALDPNAALAADVAPKLREPFVSAQAFMNAHGRLAVTATRQGAQVVVVVEADPVKLVRAIAVDASRLERQPLGSEQRITIAAPPDSKRVLGLDEYGNRIVEIAIVEPAITAPVREPASPSIVRSWKLWAAASGALFLGASVMGIVAGSADTDVQGFAFDGSHYYDEFVDARDRRDRLALIANGLFIGSGACLVTAIVMFAIRPSERSVVVSPASQGNGATVAIRRAF